MNYSLFLTKIKKDHYTENQKLFLGNWCIADEINLKNLGNYQVLNYHWNDIKKLNKDYDYLYSLYYKIIKKLANDLNKHHNIDYPERYWHVIIGSWVYKFIVNTFEKWESVRLATSNFQISKTFHYECPENYLIPSDYSEFNRLANTELWNNYLSFKIIQYFKSKINFEKINSDYTINKTFYTNKFEEKQNKLVLLTDKLLSLIQSKPKILLYKTYFGKINNLQLFYKFNSIPRTYNEFEKKIILDKPKNRKNNILKIDIKNNFEIFIKENIYKFMPISYLEGFKKIKEYTDSIKTKPDLIISAMGERNDIFSIWAAKAIQNNIKYFHTEHGAYTEDVQKFDSCISKYDYFLSWNQSKKKNVHQISPHFYVNKKNIKDGNYLYIILSSPNLYTTFISSEVKSGQYLESYENLKALKNLSTHIRDKLKFRMHTYSKLWKMRERVEKDFGVHAICKYKKLIDCFSDSKIILEEDIQTSFYESMNLNKPTIVFMNRGLSSNINEPIKNLFEDLINENLIFKDKIKLVAHIENIWSDPHKWWNSKNIHNLREKFKYLCSKKNKNFAEDILTINHLYEKTS